MRLREALKLVDGDYVVCRMCPEFGCDGTPQRVRVGRHRGGYSLYYHDGNPLAFAFGNEDGTPAEWVAGCNPRLIRMATEDEIRKAVWRWVSG